MNDDTQGKRAAEDAALKARLEKLSGALDSQRVEAKARGSKDAIPVLNNDAARAFSLGARVISELVGGVLVGAAIGYGLDWLLSTKPFLLILFLFLGTGAGFFNVIRATSGLSKTGKTGQGG